MGDFDYQSTVGKSAEEVVKLNIIGRKYNLTEAWERFRKQKADGTNPYIGYISSRTASLFDEWQATLKRVMKKPDYEDLRQKARESRKEYELIKAFDLISEWLDHLNITRIDLKKVYDTTRVENENKEQGY